MAASPAPSASSRSANASRSRPAASGSHREQRRRRDATGVVSCDSCGLPLLFERGGGIIATRVSAPRAVAPSRKERRPTDLAEHRGRELAARVVVRAPPRDLRGTTIARRRRRSVEGASNRREEEEREIGGRVDRAGVAAAWMRDGSDERREGDLLRARHARLRRRATPARRSSGRARRPRRRPRARPRCRAWRTRPGPFRAARRGRRGRGRNVGGDNKVSEEATRGETRDLRLHGRRERRSRPRVAVLRRERRAVALFAATRKGPLRRRWREPKRFRSGGCSSERSPSFLGIEAPKRVRESPLDAPRARFRSCGGQGPRTPLQSVVRKVLPTFGGTRPRKGGTWKEKVSARMSRWSPSSRASASSASRRAPSIPGAPSFGMRLLSGNVSSRYSMMSFDSLRTTPAMNDGKDETAAARRRPPHRHVAPRDDERRRRHGVDGRWWQLSPPTCHRQHTRVRPRPLYSPSRPVPPRARRTVVDEHGDEPERVDAEVPLGLILVARHVDDVRLPLEALELEREPHLARAGRLEEVEQVEPGPALHLLGLHLVRWDDGHACARKRVCVHVRVCEMRPPKKERGKMQNLVSGGGFHFYQLQLCVAPCTLACPTQQHGPS